MPKDDFYVVLMEGACDISQGPHKVLLRILWCSQ